MAAPKKRNSFVSLREIAHKANVSVATVSLILNGNVAHRFAAETQKRVVEAAEALNYRPNLLVQGIQKGRTQSIGVLIPSYVDFYNLVVAGIHDRIVEANYAPILLWSQSDAVTRKGFSELEQIHQLVDRRVDGIILKPADDGVSDQYLMEIFERNIPLVVVDRELTNTSTHCIRTDDDAGILSVFEHLRALGHQSIGYYGPGSDTSVPFKQRRLMFHKIAATHPECALQELPSPDGEADPEKIPSILLSRRRPTAIICANDWYASHVYEAARRAKLRIPDDLSVTGYGEMLSAQSIFPPLTTVDQFPYQIGVAAAERLLSEINGLNPSEKKSKRTLLQPQLLIRGSTGPVPVS